MDAGALAPAVWMKQGLLLLSRNTALRDVLEQAPVSRSVVRRFVAGDSTEQAVDAVRQLKDTQRMATLDAFDLEPAKARAREVAGIVA